MTLTSAFIFVPISGHFSVLRVSFRPFCGSAEIKFIDRRPIFLQLEEKNVRF